MQRFIEVDPGDLRVPSGRADGPNPARYSRQVRRFGSNTDDMPPIQATEGKNGELMINDGVTRAFRAHRLAPGRLVRVEIIDVRAGADFSQFQQVREISPIP